MVCNVNLLSNDLFLFLKIMWSGLRCVFLMGSVCCAPILFAQEENEQEATKSVVPELKDYFVGMDLITTGTGTVHGALTYQPRPMLDLQLGAGVLPFGRFIDIMNFIDTGRPVVDTTFGMGFYLNGGIKVGRRFPDGITMKYVYFDWFKYFFKPENLPLYSKTKITLFGYGIRLKVFQNISVEGSIGPSLIVYRGDPSFGGYESSFFAADIGLGVNYHFYKPVPKISDRP